MHPYGFGGARRERLDRLLIVGRRHLESVIKGYSRHYGCKSSRLDGGRLLCESFGWARVTAS